MPLTFSPGDPVPRFTLPARHTAKFHFDSAAGRYLVLSFIGSAGAPGVDAMLQAIAARPDVFDNHRAAFFAVSNDARDPERPADALPDKFNLHLFWDFSGAVSRRYGVLTGDEPGQIKLARTSFLLDPALRLIAVLPIVDPVRHAQTLIELIGRLPTLEQQGRPAPVLVLPRIFEPDFCKALIAYYQEKGSIDSGFMREEQGKTIGVIDYATKRRRDCEIADRDLAAAIRTRLERRLVPEIARSFNFHATRLERYIVACYDAGEGGYFRPHRDNTTKGTAHRRFAVTINLNASEYEGGDLRFPEFGPQLYRAPTGGAVVFGCSLLHEATAVTRGRRFACLPFLYDEPAHQLRQRNLGFLSNDEPLRVGAARESDERPANVSG